MKKQGRGKRRKVQEKTGEKKKELGKNQRERKWTDAEGNKRKKLKMRQGNKN
jgi:hypothetical protein